MAVARRNRRFLSPGWAPLLLVLAALCPTLARAQILILTPDCGIAGVTQVQIKGSGWAEPDPPCEYIFYWDDVEFLPRQLNGLFGPPSQSFTVPAGAAVGEHIVKVELRITDTQQLIQCRIHRFRVIAAIKDPWAMGLTIDADTMDIKFDPTDVCDVTPCTRLELIQVIMQIARRADGTERNLSYADRGFRHAAQRDSDKTAAGRVVDEPWGGRDPYATGRDPSDGLPNFMPGRQGALPKAATFCDPPWLSDRGFPVPPPDSVVRVIYEFEVNAFCSQGDDRGTYFGRATWKWERPKGGAVVLTAGTKTRDQPTQGFLDAVALWNSRHGFTLPTTAPPARGGEPCN